MILRTLRQRMIGCVLDEHSAGSQAKDRAAAGQAGGAEDAVALGGRLGLRLMLVAGVASGRCLDEHDRTAPLLWFRGGELRRSARGHRHQATDPSARCSGPGPVADGS